MKTLALAAATAATITSGGLLLTAPVAAATTAPTSADAAFVTSNEQSNLAEIALGKLAGSRGQDAATKQLASMTLSDHQKAKAMLTSAGTKAGATLPAAPNSMQLAVATQLKGAPTGSFDLMYAQAQVTAHEMALAGARTEQQTTGNAGLKSYTTFYIKIATKHLDMARAEVAALGGPPSTVPAGSGGAAATNSPSQVGRDIWLGGGVLVIVAGLSLATRRRFTRALR